MGRRVELPEVTLMADGEFILVTSPGKGRQLNKNELDEMEHRCNHYMELVEALEQIVSEQWDLLNPMNQENAKEALAKAKGE